LTIEPLPVGVIHRTASGWWGMTTFIATEGALFAYLLFSYFFFAVQEGPGWLPSELPGFTFSGANLGIVFLITIAIWAGEFGIRRDRQWQLVAGLAIALVLSAVFIALQAIEWSEEPFTISSNSYGSLYYLLTGFHLAHVFGGFLVLAALTLWSALGYFDRFRIAPVSIGLMYWVFVDVVWVAIFLTIYVSPRLGLG
jgi:heme/copper-type cytochrome/quinol oxidase subunit 3